MTLAAILSLSIFCAASALPLVGPKHQSAPQSAPASKPAETAPMPDQGSAPPAQDPSAPTQPPPTDSPGIAPKKSSTQTPARTVKPRRKKRVLPANCVAAPATGSQPSADTTRNSAPDVTGTANAPTAATQSAPTNCPPSRVIVRHGGTSEPSIQLAGGDTTSQRETANRMLGTTEANLKKIARRTLSSTQQDMVNQIRQFVEQSKAAVGDGNLERARTLAWKAQLLSEELIKPGK